MAEERLLERWEPEGWEIANIGHFGSVGPQTVVDLEWMKLGEDAGREW